MMLSVVTGSMLFPYEDMTKDVIAVTSLSPLVADAVCIGVNCDVPQDSSVLALRESLFQLPKCPARS